QVAQDEALEAPAAAPMAEMAADGAVARGGAMAGAAYGRAEMRMKSSTGGQQAANEASAAPVVEPTIRKEFADTAFWAGSLETDREGIAKISLKMPENLTTWQIRAWA